MRMPRTQLGQLRARRGPNSSGRKTTRLRVGKNDDGSGPAHREERVSGANPVYPSTPIRAEQFSVSDMVDELMGLLKPGGILGIIDRHGDADADNAAPRRIEKARVVEAAKATVFEIAGDSDLLASPGGDWTRMVFAETIRGKTGRFLLKPIKPEGR